MRQQIAALQVEVSRLMERLDQAENLLQGAAPFGQRRPAGKAIIRGSKASDDLGKRIDSFLSRIRRRVQRNSALAAADAAAWPRSAGFSRRERGRMRRRVLRIGSRSWAAA
jgi:hypothetical protein